MSLSSQDFDIIKRYLEKFQTMACPICFNKRWSIAGVALPPEVDTTTNSISMGRGVPKVQVCCEECGYVNEFSWLFIKSKVESHG